MGVGVFVRQVADQPGWGDSGAPTPWGRIRLVGVARGQVPKRSNCTQASNLVRNARLHRVDLSIRYLGSCAGRGLRLKKIVAMPDTGTRLALVASGSGGRGLRMEQAQCSAACGISAARDPVSPGPRMLAHARLATPCISRHSL